MDELVGDFLTETLDGLDVLNNELVTLEQNPKDEAILGNIFRVMHTIKGTCGFLGFEKLESVAHAGENILGKIRDKELLVTKEAITYVLQVVDAIKVIVEHIENSSGNEPDVDNSDLISQVNHYADTGEVFGDATESLPLAETQAGTFEDAVEAAAIDTKQNDLNTLEANVAQAKAVVAAAAAAAEAEEPPLAVEIHKPDAEIASPAPDTPPLQPKQPEAKQEDSGKKEPGKVTQSLRVNLDVLEHLMQEVSELVLTRNQLLQMARNDTDNAFSAPLQRLSHITSELQDSVMKTRMQPIGNAWAQFPRLIRDLSIELSKEIELVMEGQETELDRQLLAVIKDPLTHMVRNSADHGIEKPEERIAAGKSSSGTVKLRAYHEGGHIIISIADDGRGIALEKIKNKIIEKGLSTAEELETMNPVQIRQYIFHPGFSTAEQVTSVSGRGVGMDVVKNNIQSIGGSVTLHSSEGEGSTFLIKIPLTLAIMPVLITKVKEQHFAIPQINVIELVKAGARSEHVIEVINNKPVLRLREKLLTLVSVSEILEIEDATEEEKLERYLSDQGVFIVVCQVGGTTFGLIVDKVFDTEEIVVKPVSPILRGISIYSGSTILGDGSVIMIMDMMGALEAIGASVIDEKNQQNNAASSEEESIIVLKFKSGDGSPKVVPLELVSRLEEIDVSNIEVSCGKRLIQYRDKLMRIVCFDDNYELPEKGTQELIVFSHNQKIMGLVVEEILDIVKCELGNNRERSSDPSGKFLESIVIGNETCDVINISYFYEQVFNDTANKNNALSREAPMIILVDDSPFFRRFVPPTLLDEGYNVESFSSAEEAIEYLNGNNKVNLIITDMNMPGMNGEKFIEYVKTSEQLSSIPMIAMSSYSSEEIATKAGVELFERIEGYVDKTNYSALISLIRQCNI